MKYFRVEEIQNKLNELKNKGIKQIMMYYYRTVNNFNFYIGLTSTDIDNITIEGKTFLRIIINSDNILNIINCDCIEIEE